MEETAIWFWLIMVSNGHAYWLGAWETLEECQTVQAAYEADPDHKGDKFACPWVEVKKT
jgi:hypothetical protein